MATAEALKGSKLRNKPTVLRMVRRRESVCERDSGINKM